MSNLLDKMRELYHYDRISIPNEAFTIVKDVPNRYFLLRQQAFQDKWVLSCCHKTILTLWNYFVNDVPPNQTLLRLNTYQEI